MQDDGMENGTANASTDLERRNIRMGDVGINHALYEYTALRDGVRVSEVMVGGERKWLRAAGRIAFLHSSYLLREGIIYRFFEAGEGMKARSVSGSIEG